MLYATACFIFTVQMVAIPWPFHSFGVERQRLVQGWFESKIDFVNACLSLAIPPTSHRRLEVSPRQIEVSENETRRAGWFYQDDRNSWNLQDEMLDTNETRLNTSTWPCLSQKQFCCWLYSATIWVCLGSSSFSPSSGEFLRMHRFQSNPIHPWFIINIYVYIYIHPNYPILSLLEKGNTKGR